jgi:hypothetical protein
LPRWGKLWAERCSTWLAHIGRYAESLLAAALAVQLSQLATNKFLRMVGMCSGRRASLGIRVVEGPPSRWIEGVARTAVKHCEFKRPSLVLDA